MILQLISIQYCKDLMCELEQDSPSNVNKDLMCVCEQDSSSNVNKDLICVCEQDSPSNVNKDLICVCEQDLTYIYELPSVVGDDAAQCVTTM